MAQKSKRNGRTRKRVGIAITLLGLGLFFVVINYLNIQRSQRATTFSGMVDQISEAAEGVGNEVGNLGESIGDMGEQIGETAGSLGESIGDTVGGFGRSIGDFFGGRDTGMSWYALWPLVLVVIGLYLLLRPAPRRKAKNDDLAADEEWDA